MSSSYMMTQPVPPLSRNSSTYQDFVKVSNRSLWSWFPFCEYCLQCHAQWRFGYPNTSIHFFICPFFLSLSFVLTVSPFFRLHPRTTGSSIPWVGLISSSSIFTIIFSGVVYNYCIWHRWKQLKIPYHFKICEWFCRITGSVGNVSALHSSVFASFSAAPNHGSEEQGPEKGSLEKTIAP